MDDRRAAGLLLELHSFYRAPSTANARMMMPTALKSLMQGKQMEPFIRHIRFPFFKNLQENTRIDFDFPITALVGVNGSSKSSVLRALFGCPGYSNLGDYWFSTKVDPIVETNGAGRNRFIYGYMNQSESSTVEVIKTRIHKKSDPDYWEPSRPLTGDDMAPMPPYVRGAKGRSATRWQTIGKSVLLIDFRQHLSAFDKAFHHYDDTKSGTRKERKVWIKARSAVLKRALDGGGDSFSFYGKERFDEKRYLAKAEIDDINKVLQKDYSEILHISHSLFDVNGETVILKSKDLTYTEAFAGSGEFSVVSLVVKVRAAPEKSLILLDEPEVSLHPGAQERLVSFLIAQVKTKKHQIVYATHSPSMIRNLPPEAIKVFLVDPKTGKTSIPSQSASPETAFFYIGEPLGNKTIVVEDALAAEFVNRARRLLDPALMSLLKPKFFPGGSETLWAHFAPTYAAENRKDILILFDGDKTPQQQMVASNTIPEAENQTLESLIKNFSGVNINFHPDGSKGQSKAGQRFQMQRSFMDWAKSNVAFFPAGETPEELLWRIMPQDSLTASISKTNAKERFVELTRKERALAESEQVDALMILETQIRRLALLDQNTSEIKTICDLLKSFAERPL